MAVQKSRKSKSKKGMRRSHHGLEGSAMSVDKTTGGKTFETSHS